MSTTIKTWVDRRGYLRVFVGGKEIPNVTRTTVEQITGGLRVNRGHIVIDDREKRYNVTLELTNVRIDRVSKKPG